MRVHERSIHPSVHDSALAPIRAAYQGIPGAFGEEAVRRAWRGRATPIPARTFAEAVEQVVAGVVERAVIPIWNSTIGPVAPACAALDARDDAIRRTRTIDVPVHHCLLALPGATVGDVRYVGSHAAALGQCARLFATHHQFTACEAFDTAGAAKELSLLIDPTHRLAPDSWYSTLASDARHLAVIASADAGRRYGLSMLLDGVQDDPTNLTRFVVVRSRTVREW